jgi:hypothetical protein
MTEEELIAMFVVGIVGLGALILWWDRTLSSREFRVYLYVALLIGVLVALGLWFA